MKQRGRGGRARRNTSKSSGVLAENPVGQPQIGINGKSIFPGQIVCLTPAEMDNPGVKKFFKEGALRKVKQVSMVKRLVKEKPKILVVVHTMFRGGAEISTIETHRQLKVLGVEQAMLNCYVGDTAFHSMLEKEAQAVFDVYMSYKLSSNDKIRTIVREFAQTYKPDVVLYSLRREVPEGLATMPDRPPVIQVMHSELEDSHWGYDPVATDAVITVSQRMSDNIQAQLDVPEHKIFPIWNGIDPSRIFKGVSLRNELGIPEGAIVVGMVGNLNPLKRPVFGLEVFAKARSAENHMVFAGNPDMENAVRDKASELGLTQYVHILGLRDDVKNVYATIDVMMNCSTMEGLPMTIIEAMFARLPVIASAVGGNPEIVSHGKTGYICAPDDADAFVKALESLIASPNRRKGFGYEGFLLAGEHFHIETVGQQYLDVINEYTINPNELKCSVVMPVYNGDKWLDRAIWSVRRQTMADFEFFIMNDGSIDDSRNIILRHAARDARIKLIDLQHGGIVKALNGGIRASRTALIARMDADDEMVPNRLERQLEYMEAHPDIDVLGTQMFARSADGVDMGPMLLKPCDHDGIERAMSTENPMSHPTVMLRKAAWKKIGGYKGDGRCEDYRMWVEMMLAGFTFANMEEALLIYQHTHDGDPDYGKWRDSVLPEIQKMFSQGKRVDMKQQKKVTVND